MDSSSNNAIAQPTPFLWRVLLVIALLAACAPKNEPALPDDSFDSKLFEVYRKKCGENAGCLIAIESLRQCYIDRKVYGLEAELTQESMNRLLDEREKCAKILGLPE